MNILLALVPISLILLGIALFLVTYIPELSLWLPKLILGKAG